MGPLRLCYNCDGHVAKKFIQDMFLILTTFQYWCFSNLVSIFDTSLQNAFKTRKFIHISPKHVQYKKIQCPENFKYKMTATISIFSCRYLLVCSIVGILALKYVWLDTKIRFLNRLGAKIIDIIGRPFCMAAIEAKTQIWDGPIAKKFPQAMLLLCTKFHASITYWAILSYFAPISLTK